MYEWMSEQADAVERKVESTERDGKPARAVVAARSYPTAIDDLWDAITDPERIKRWFLPVSGDLGLGGRYQLKGNAGGTIERCDPPRLLSVSWEFGGNTSWVNVRLEVDGEDDTKLTLEHIAPEDEAGLKFWDQFGPGAVGVGWDLGLLGLYKHLESPGEPMPKEDDLLAPPEGRALAATLSDGWRAANVAFGTDERAAHESAARTTAFYTGVQADTGSDTGG